MTLTGLVCIRNGEELDYCWREAIKSLLPICDSVCVCDGESTDGTQDIVRKWMLEEPRITLCVYPWPEPKGDPNFWTTWLQYARQHCPPGRILQLDGDEVLHEDSANAIHELSQREGAFTVRCRRYNFWRDIRSLIPEGVCCDHQVTRMGPQNVFIPSDGAHPEGAQWTNMAEWNDRITIFHYGFLRKREAFFRKAKAIQGMFFNDYDKRLEAAEKYDGPWHSMEGITGWESSLVPFEGTHPAVAKDWLRARNHEV